jgi:hypothetical protein
VNSNSCHFTHAFVVMMHSNTPIVLKFIIINDSGNCNMSFLETIFFMAMKGTTFPFCCNFNSYGGMNDNTFCVCTFYLFVDSFSTTFMRVRFQFTNGIFYNDGCERKIHDSYFDFMCKAMASLCVFMVCFTFTLIYITWNEIALHI